MIEKRKPSTPFDAFIFKHRKGRAKVYELDCDELFNHLFELWKKGLGLFKGGIVVFAF